MKKSDFFYFLPQKLIAQRPIEPRDHSRLMILDRQKEAFVHEQFYNIINYLRAGDCLVLNDTKVLPARIFGTKEPSGSVVEFLLLHTSEQDIWECITGPGKKAQKGAVFSFGDGLMKAEVLEILENGNRRVHFAYEGSFYEILDKIGQIPLPPYITAVLEDKNRYQTIYAREAGSAAAPTAGLHFTPNLLEQIREMGVEIAYVTLHVGVGTFRPVKAGNIEEHEMHAEFFTIDAENAAKINTAKKSGGRIIAVGTTSCRSLESAADERGFVQATNRWTDIFIYPGYKFRCVNALLTNFHLPESSLIMLVSAFCGLEMTKKAYECAIGEEYRFFSFGDAMLIL